MPLFAQAVDATTNPALGMLIFILGGLAGATFYLPFKKVQEGIPVLVVVFLGGFAVNAGWCLFLNARNRTTGDYVNSATPLAANFLFAGLAGALWCSQLICVKTGAPAMGTMGYLGWSVLMASTILFSSLLGIGLGEWKNTSARTRLLLTLGLASLVSSSVISGYSGYLSQ